MKIPLNDVAPKATAAKGTPKKRGRPRKSDVQAVEEVTQEQSSEQVVKRLRRDLPARRNRRQSGLVNEILPEHVNEDTQSQNGDTEATQTPSQQQPKKKRGRPRKSDIGVASTPAAEDTLKPSPKKRKLKPYRDQSLPSSSPAASQAGEEQSKSRDVSVESGLRGSEADYNSTQEQDDDGASYASGVPENVDTINVGDDTAQLDRSAVESEGFSIVNLQSLRSQREQAEREEEHEQSMFSRRNSGHSDDPGDDADEALNSSDIQLGRSQLAPDGGSSPSLPGPSRQNLNSLSRPIPQTRVSRPQGSIFNAYSDRTQRDLRQSLLTGEQMARENSRNTPLQTTKSSSNLLAGDFGRLPTPTDSVDSTGKATADHVHVNSRLSRSHDEMSWRPSTTPRAQATPQYDPMSWRPEGPSTQSKGRNQSTTAEDAAMEDSDIWRDEAERLVDDSLQAPKQRQRTRRREESGMPPPSPKQAQALGLEPLPVKRLQARMDETAVGQESPRRAIQPFNNNTQPSPVPSLSDIVSSDDRPTRGKIPRTWRRASNSDFLYSDEAQDSPEKRVEERPRRKPAFNSPVVPIQPQYPSLFQRLDARPRSNQERPQRLTTDDDRVHERTNEHENHIENHNDDANHNQPEDRERTPEFKPRPRKSILSSPARRSVSPAKSVTWRGEDSLEELHVDDTQYSSHMSPERLCSPDGVDDINDNYDDDDSMLDDEEPIDGTSLGGQIDDSNLADVEDTFDSTQLPSSPLNARSNLKDNAHPMSPGNASTTSLPDTASSDESDIPQHAKAMSRTASASKPSLPNPTLPDDQHTKNQGLLSMIASYLRPILPAANRSNPHSPQLGPHTWTRQHQELLVSLFVVLPCLNLLVPFVYDPAINMHRLNLIHRLPGNAAKFPAAFFVPVQRIPPAYVREVGKTYSSRPSCDKGPACGPYCEGVPWRLRFTNYRHEIKEADIRVAFTLSILLKYRGLVQYEGPVWEAAEKKHALRDEEGKAVVKREDWSTQKQARELVWRVFGMWVNVQMAGDEQKNKLSQGEENALADGEDEATKLWRERGAWGL